MKTRVLEKDGRIFLVGGITPATPANPAEEYAYASDMVDKIRKSAPNGNIAWYEGHYVESEVANANGAMWRADDIVAASATPLLMPVTVMHDPTFPVGLVAGSRLRTPAKDGVPAPKIDTALALWAHRHPEVQHEAMANYEAGSLGQSMECLSPEYECSECAALYHKLPGDAEQDQWCEHLRGETASRVLKNFTFTGTGLIFGTRNATPADPNATLSAIADEVAEFHDRARHPQSKTPRKKTTPKTGNRIMEIEDARYAELLAIEERAKNMKTSEEFAAEKQRADTAVAESEKLAIDKKAAEDLATAEKKRADDLAEKERAESMAKDRIGKFGSAFRAKIPAEVAERVTGQAASMSDEEWAERVKELEAFTGTKHDAAAEGDDAAGKDDDTAGSAPSGDLFTTEETAASLAGFGVAPSAPKNAPLTDAARGSLIAGL